MNSLFCYLPFSGCSLNDRDAFDREIQALRASSTTLAGMVSNDAQVRIAYQQQVAQAAQALERDVASGRLSWQAAAEKARALRNDIMEIMRGRTSSIGRALAEQMKAQGLTRETLLARYTERLFGQNASFRSLSRGQQDRVFAEIVRAAGRSNPRVNAMMTRWSRVGRGLIVLSLGVSVYNIVTAEDPGQQAVEEGAVLGAGVLGGMAGGATAGLVCGPGAPVCVTVGAFIGGALAAFGVGALF